MGDFWQGMVMALSASALFVGGHYLGLESEAALGVYGVAGALSSMGARRLSRRGREAAREMRGEPPAGGAALAVALALAVSGCGVLSGHDARDGAVRCARDAVPAVVGEVAAVMASGGAGWQDRLASLAAQVGQRAVVCSAEELLDAWAREPTVEAQAAALRCETYLRTVDSGGDG